MKLKNILHGTETLGGCEIVFAAITFFTKTLKIMENKLFKQYQELKAKHPDALLLFRCGDFYKTFSDDAKDASNILGITLMKVGGIMSAGFPHHALDWSLPKLIRAGKRVAICDQLEKPKPTAKRSIKDLL